MVYIDHENDATIGGTHRHPDQLRLQKSTRCVDLPAVSPGRQQEAWGRNVYRHDTGKCGFSHKLWARRRTWRDTRCL